MIINEEPYVALSLGDRSWIIKSELNEKELINIIERKKYKLNIIKTYGKIPMKYLQNNWISSWEVYEKCCKDYYSNIEIR